MTPDAPMTAQDALAALMVAVSASDETIRTAELVKMSNSINNLPVFAEYDAERLPRVSKMVFELLEQEDGLEALFGLIRDALPERLFETAYALSCDVAAADGAFQSGPHNRGEAAEASALVPAGGCEVISGFLKADRALGLPGSVPGGIWGC